MLQQRVLTALALMSILLACLFWLPPMAWQLLVGVPLWVGLQEWGKLSGLSTYSSLTYAVIATILAVIIWQFDGSAWLYAISALLWLVVVPVWLVAEWRVNALWVRLPLGLLILAPMWMAMMELRQRGAWWVLAVMAVVWIADSAAYFSGRALGRHKLAPAISPGKTWEGVAGALMGVSLYGAAILMLMQHQQLDVSAWIKPVALLAVLMLYLSILGDLFESWIKRLAGVKDSGTVLPGHGGVLDRIDALTSTMPVAALIILHSDLLLKWL